MMHYAVLNMNSILKTVKRKNRLVMSKSHCMLARDIHEMEYISSINDMALDTVRTPISPNFGG